MKVIIPFANFSSVNPNVGNIPYTNQLDVYYRCSLVAMASFRRWNADLELEFVTNVLPAKYVCDAFAQFDVAIKLVPFRHVEERALTFGASFYLLDAILNNSADCLFIDPDVVCLGTIEELINFCQKESGLGVFRLSPEQNQKLNGMSPTDAQELYKLITGYKSASYSHLGGEILFVPRHLSDNLKSEIETLWSKVKELTNNHSFFTTEEHFLSALISSRPSFALNAFITRIWTTKTYKATEGSDHNLECKVLWHVPAEKSHGFQSIWNEISTDSSLFYSMNGNAFRRYITRKLNIRLSALAQIQAYFLRHVLIHLRRFLSTASFEKSSAGKH